MWSVSVSSVLKRDKNERDIEGVEGIEVWREK
jgi:hypothetical protein